MFHPIAKRFKHEIDVALKVEHQLLLFIFRCREPSVTLFQSQWCIPVEQSDKRSDSCYNETVDLGVEREWVSNSFEIAIGWKRTCEVRVVFEPLQIDGIMSSA